MLDTFNSTVTLLSRQINVSSDSYESWEKIRIYFLEVKKKHILGHILNLEV